MKDPCPYCLRYLADVARLGCGSREAPQEQANEWCEVFSIMRRHEKKDQTEG